MILHRSSVHFHDATSCMNHETGVNHSIIECHKERCDFEYRTRLASVTDSIVNHLIIFSVTPTSHIYYCLDISCLNFHKDGHAHLTVYLLEFFNNGSFCQILHTDINSCYYVTAVDWIKNGNVQIFLQDFTTMHHTIGASQFLVECKLQAVLGTVNLSKKISDSSSCQCGKWFSSCIKFLPMESSYTRTLAEDRQFSHLAECVVVYTAWPDCPVACTDASILHNLLLAF